MALRDDIVSFLRNSQNTAMVDIRLPGYAMNSGTFSRVADALGRRHLEQGRATHDISVTHNPSMREGIGGTWDSIRDELTLPFASLDRRSPNFDRSVLIHETAHCALDLDGVDIAPLENEAIAYLAQAQYLSRFPITAAGASLTDSSGGAALMGWNPLLGPIQSLAPSRTGRMLQRSDLTDLVRHISSHAAYQHLGGNFSNGIRGRRPRTVQPFGPPELAQPALMERPIGGLTLPEPAPPPLPRGTRPPPVGR